MPSTVTLPIPGPRATWLALGLATGMLVAAVASPAFAPRPIGAADPTSPPEHTLAVTVRDLAKIGDAVDDSLAAGATTLDGVTFRVDDPTQAERQARQEAMAEAKSKAQALASGAGVSIKGVASISESSAPIPYPIPYPAPYLGAALARDEATPVQVGTNEVVVTVAVVYLID